MLFYQKGSAAMAKNKTPDLPMKWFFALIYFFIPFDLLRGASQIIRDVQRLFSGEILSVRNTPLPATPPFIFRLVYGEVVSVGCMVLLIIAWISLLKRKSSGPKLFLIQILVSLADIPAIVLHYVLIKPYIQLPMSAESLDKSYYILIGIAAAVVLGARLLFFFLNRLYFKKRTVYFPR